MSTASLKAQIIKATLTTSVLNELQNLPGLRWEGVVHDTMIVSDVSGQVYEVEIRVRPK